MEDVTVLLVAGPVIVIAGVVFYIYRLQLMTYFERRNRRIVGNKIGDVMARTSKPGYYVVMSVGWIVFGCALIVLGFVKWSQI